MKRPPSSGPSVKIDINKPTSRREKAAAAGPKGAKAAPRSLKDNAVDMVVKEVGGEIGKRAGKWALEKLGLGKKGKKATVEGKSDKAVAKRILKALSGAGSTLGSAGAGIPKTLSKAQRAFRKVQMEAARAFRWT